MPTGRLPLLLAATAGLCCAIAGGARALAGMPAQPPSSSAAKLERVADQTRVASINPAQLASIEKYIDAHGRKTVIDPDVSQGLKLGKGGAPVTADQVSLIDKNDPKGRHVLDRLTDGSGFLIERQTLSARALYQVGKNLELMNAVVVRVGTHGRGSLMPAEAAQAAGNELRIWAAKVAEQR